MPHTVAFWLHYAVWLPVGLPVACVRTHVYVLLRFVCVTPHYAAPPATLPVVYTAGYLAVRSVDCGYTPIRFLYHRTVGLPLYSYGYT